MVCQATFSDYISCYGLPSPFYAIKVFIIGILYADESSFSRCAVFLFETGAAEIHFYDYRG